jgi:hypothetical protein
MFCDKPCKKHKKSLSEAQEAFIKLEKQKQDYRQYFEDLQVAVKAVADEVGIGGMFQDEEGTVYEVVIPEGKFVHFDKIGYNRTRRGEEKRGDLSLKKAREAGFEVE